MKSVSLLGSAVVLGLAISAGSGKAATFNLVYENATGMAANDFHLDVSRSTMVKSATTGFYDDVKIGATGNGQRVSWTVLDADLPTAAGGFHGFRIEFADGGSPADITDAWFTLNGNRLQGGGAVLVRQNEVNPVPLPGAGFSALIAFSALMGVRRRRRDGASA